MMKKKIVENKKIEEKIYEISYRIITRTDETLSDYWDAIKSESRFLTEWGIDILKSGLKDSVKAIVIEYPYICKDHTNLYINYYSKQFKNKNRYTERFHFFTEDLPISHWKFDDTKFDSIYIGNSVIRPLTRCIGSTYINPERINFFNKSNHYCMTVKKVIHFQGKHRTIKAFPYISQDTDVTQCAHAALWAICRYLSTKYNLYKELYLFDIVSMATEIGGRKYPFRGLTTTDYSQILTNFGASPEILFFEKQKYKKKLNPDDMYVIYTYIESGIPLIASLRPKQSPGHAVSIIGHTIDFDKIKKLKNDGRNKFISSSRFVDRYIIIDDNSFPYAYLSQNDKHNFSNIYDLKSIKHAVCPLPSKVFLDAIYIKKYLDNALLVWLDDFNKFQKGPYITRTFLSSCTAYVRNKMKQGNDLDDPLAFRTAGIFLPHFIWIVEISSGTQFKDVSDSKGLAFSEIILDATSGAVDNPLIFIRIGNELTFNGKKPIPEGNITEFPIFRHNLGEKD